MTLPELFHELKVVAGAAKKVSVNHDKVAVNCGISRVYLDKLKGGSRTLRDDDKGENKKLIQKIIVAYRRELESKQRDIKKVLGK